MIYATGMYGRSALASRLRRVPLVIKLVSDPAYERARRLGLFSGTLEEFQRSSSRRGVRYLKRAQAADACARLQDHHSQPLSGGDRARLGHRRASG